MLRGSSRGGLIAQTLGQQLGRGIVGADNIRHRSLPYGQTLSYGGTLAAGSNSGGESDYQNLKNAP